jgi:SAM-dependent methyltransferase
VSTDKVESNIDSIYYRDGASFRASRYIMRKAREKIFSLFMNEFRPTRASRILDLGVSDEENDGANILEKLYPYQDRLTCAGLGDGRLVLSSYPGIKFIKIFPGQPFPFQDGAFDVVYSNAVLEHVGGQKERQRFILELLRVARAAFITVPNRWFPVEHHTGIPLLHFNKRLFRLIVRRTAMSYWSDPGNLEFLDKAGLAKEWIGHSQLKMVYTGLRLGPFSSNIALIVKDTLAS